MTFVPMLDLLKKAVDGGYAVPAFCVWNAETVKTVLHVATRLRAPVILMHGPGEFPLFDPPVMSAIACALAGSNNSSVAMHLDHGNSIEQVEACLKAGYTSVMLDFSTKPFQENATALRQVVDMAHPLNVTVEGEIGSVGRVDDATTEGDTFSNLTDPEEAVLYVRTTGVDALAVAIGNAHGNYSALPHLEFELLEKIHSSVNIPLVLHGGSGTPEHDLKKAISMGIAKVNVASELVRAVRESLREQWNAGENLWTPVAIAQAMAEVAKVIEKWIYFTDAAGKA